MTPLSITVVPHTHWDREWYAPFSEFSERLVAMMDSLLDLADRGFPHFHLDGQTALIDDYLERRPERAGDVARHVRDGRLSAGPWFTQMDEFLTSGESHIRNLERGLSRSRELGRALETGYMPDQFGHIAQMPQILRLCGLERALVWRGVPRAIDRDAFWWEAPDGSRVLAGYMAFGYFNGSQLETIEDPQALADAIGQAVDRQRPFLSGDRMLLMVGYDHSGPAGTLPERLDAARPYLDGIDVEVTGIARFMEVGRTGELPVWSGELRSSARAPLLPNVVSARVNQKRERGRVEALVERYAEPLAALVPGFPWPADQMDRVWKLLLWNGAHDSACGCSHDQVAIDVDARFAEARSLAEGVVGRALLALGSQVHEAGVLRWNPSAFEREGVPALGWRVDEARRESVPAPVEVAELFGGSIAAGGLELRLLDEPDAGDLYNFCEARTGQLARPPAEITVTGHDVRLWFDDRLQVVMSVTRGEGEHFLRLEGTITNRRPDHRLRLHVRLPAGVTESLAGAPFELVRRPVLGEGSEVEVASPTWPARGLVMAGSTAVCSHGVFEYELTGGELVVTLLRCVGTISRGFLSTRPFAAGPDVATPLAQMIGGTTFSLGVQANARASSLMADYERFALPLSVTTSTGGGRLAKTGALLEITGDAQISNVRLRDGRVEVRLWNSDKQSPAEAVVAGHRVMLGPARIETVGLGEARALGGP